MLDVNNFDELMTEEESALCEAQRIRALALETQLSKGEDTPEHDLVILAERQSLLELYKDLVLMAASAKIRINEIDQMYDERLGRHRNIIFQSCARWMSERRQPFFALVARFHR